MPSGYQNRLSNTYWIGTNLTWSGSDWTSIIAVASVELTPTGAMDRTSDEIRIFMSLTGTVQVDLYDDSTYIKTFILSGNASETLVVRRRGTVTTSIKLLFDNLSTVTITEIEAGYNGTHFP